MNENILVVNVHSSRNAGDAALSAMTSQLLRENFPGCQLTFVMDDPASHVGDEQVIGSIFTWLKTTQAGQTPTWRKSHLLWLLPAAIIPLATGRAGGRPFFGFTPAELRPLLRAYREADLVVSTAGGFLYHSGNGLTLAISLLKLGLAHAAGKPLYLFPQSIGPIASEWERWLLRWALRRARLVMVREPLSEQFLKEAGLWGTNCHLLPDLAFGFPSEPEERAQLWLKDHGVDLDGERPLLGVTMINWGAQNRRYCGQEAYEAAVEAAIRHFIEHHHGKVVLLPQVCGPAPSQDDRLPARRVMARMQDLSAAIVLAEEPLPSALLKAVFGQMDVFIGSRMHSNIFALSEGVPVIAIAYQPKTLGIMQMAGLGEWVLDIGAVNGKTLVNRLEALWAQREMTRENLWQSVRALRDNASAAGKLIASDYAQFARNKQ